MKTSYHILNSKTNKYISVIVDCIEKNNIEVDSFNLKKEEVQGEATIYNLNWYESVFPKNIIKGYINFYKKKYILKLLKKNNKKIVWTVHNKEAHDERYKSLSKKLIKELSKQSDEIIVHCKETINFLKENYNEIDEKKINYIPHPNYIGVYKEENIDFRKKLNIKEDEFVFLFIGQIRAYKNVELIIDLAKEITNKKVKFVVAGNPNSNIYKEELLKRIGNEKNIIPIFRFIKDEELTSLIKASDMMLLPYDIKSSLNSGSIILSFSNGRTVIAPNIGTLKDIENKSLFKAYEYNDEKEHYEKMKENVLEVINKWENNEMNLKKIESDLINLMKNEYSHELVSSLYNRIYKKYDRGTENE